MTSAQPAHRTSPLPGCSGIVCSIFLFSPAPARTNALLPSQRLLIPSGFDTLVKHNRAHHACALVQVQNPILFPHCHLNVLLFDQGGYFHQDTAHTSSAVRRFCPLSTIEAPPWTLKHDSPRHRLSGTVHGCGEYTTLHKPWQTFAMVQPRSSTAQ